MMTVCNRAPSGYVEDENLAIVNFKGPGEDEASSVTLVSLAMTRHSVQTSIYLLNRLLADMQTADTTEEVVKLRANE